MKGKSYPLKPKLKEVQSHQELLPNDFKYNSLLFIPNGISKGRNGRNTKKLVFDNHITTSDIILKPYLFKCKIK